MSEGDMSRACCRRSSGVLLNGCNAIGGVVEVSSDGGGVVK